MRDDHRDGPQAQEFMLHRSRPREFDASNSADTRLAGALAKQVGPSRDRDHVRSAISAWCRDVAGTRSKPEEILIQFKGILANLDRDRLSTDYEQRLEERREMIRMCIEEYFSGVRFTRTSD